MTTDFSSIDEVIETGRNNANYLLSLSPGYQLLAVEQVAKGVERTREPNAPWEKEGDPNLRSDFHVEKYLVYVLGRNRHTIGENGWALPSMRAVLNDYERGKAEARRAAKEEAEAGTSEPDPE